MTYPHSKSQRKVTAGGRIRHTIEAGQSLASIALKQYGDARFARLIFTINRGEIPIRCDGFNTFAFVYPSQRLLLPTIEEAQIYQNNFFTESSRIKFDLAHYARPAMPSDSIPQELLHEKIEAPRQAMIQHIAAQPEVQKFEDMPVFRSVHDVEHAETKFSPSVPSEAHPHLRLVQNEAAASKQISIDMTPPVEKAAAPVSAPAHVSVDVADDHEIFFAQGSLEITSLSHYCRLMQFEAMEANSSLMIKLQVFDQNKWQTIASYVVQQDATRRLAHYADGSSNSVNIELPRNVVKELSLTDFNRNWKNYTKVYFNHKEKVRLEQLTSPASMMLHAV